MDESLNDIEKEIENLKLKEGDNLIELYFDAETGKRYLLATVELYKQAITEKTIPSHLVLDYLKILFSSPEIINEKTKELAQNVVNKFPKYDFSNEYNLDRINLTIRQYLNIKSEGEINLATMVTSVFIKTIFEKQSELKNKTVKANRDECIRFIFYGLTTYLNKRKIKFNKYKKYVLSAYMAELLGFKNIIYDKPTNEKYFFAGKYAVEHKKKNPIN